MPVSPRMWLPQVPPGMYEKISGCCAWLSPRFHSLCTGQLTVALPFASQSARLSGFILENWAVTSHDMSDVMVQSSSTEWSVSQPWRLRVSTPAGVLVFETLTSMCLERTWQTFRDRCACVVVESAALRWQMLVLFFCEKLLSLLWKKLRIVSD